MLGLFFAHCVRNPQHPRYCAAMDNVANQPVLPLSNDAAAMRAAEEIISSCPQVHISTEHLIHGGMYARTICIPEGVVLAGAPINLPTISICDGDIEVTTDSGPKRLTGRHVIPATAGFQRFGRAYADTHWTMIFPTELTDLADIEAAMTDRADELMSRKAIEAMQ